MPSPPVAALLAFQDRPDTGIVWREQHVELRAQRCDVRIVVTVPKEVLEWFVDASAGDDGPKVSDWWDYEGYDRTPRDQLARDMARDITGFVAPLLERPLRFGSRRGWFRSRPILEWEAAGEWGQALPFA